MASHACWVGAKHHRRTTLTAKKLLRLIFRFFDIFPYNFSTHLSAVLEWQFLNVECVGILTCRHGTSWRVKGERRWWWWWVELVRPSGLVYVHSSAQRWAIIWFSSTKLVKQANENSFILFYSSSREMRGRRKFKIARVFSRFSLYAGRVFAFHHFKHNTTCVLRGCVQWKGVKFEFNWGFHKKTAKYLSSNFSSKEMEISLCCENFPMLIHMTFVC